jgi:transposase InsO family protein
MLNDLPPQPVSHLVSGNKKTKVLPPQAPLHLPKTWSGVMDTGAEVSVSGCKKSMHDMVRLKAPMYLLCADGTTKHAVHERGVVTLKCGIVLKNVYHCPEWSSHNYVSIHALCKDGYMIIIDGDIMKVVNKKTGSIMTDIPAEGRSWRISAQSVKHAQGTITERTRLLKVHKKLMMKHRAYGHPGNNTLLNVIKCTDDHGLTKDEIREIPNLPRCHECDQAQMPKHNGAKVLRHKHACLPNRLVMHSDLSGRKKASVRGFQHYALYVTHKHDGTKMTTRYLMCDLLRNKNDLAGALEKRLKLIKNIGKNEGVAMFMSDNGGEHTSKHTQRMLAEHGIAFNPSAPS